MKNLMKRFVQDDQGQDLIEYAILIGLITVGVVAIVATIGTWVNGQFSQLNADLAASSCFTRRGRVTVALSCLFRQWFQARCIRGGFSVWLQVGSASRRSLNGSFAMRTARTSSSTRF